MRITVKVLANANNHPLWDINQGDELDNLAVKDSLNLFEQHRLNQAMLELTRGRLKQLLVRLRLDMYHCKEAIIRGR